jgi:hypothetical protein
MLNIIWSINVVSANHVKSFIDELGEKDGAEPGDSLSVMTDEDSY